MARLQDLHLDAVLEGPEHTRTLVQLHRPTSAGARLRSVMSTSVLTELEDVGWHARRRGLVLELVGDHVLRVGSSVKTTSSDTYLRRKRLSPGAACFSLSSYSLSLSLLLVLFPLDVHGVDEFVGLGYRVVGRADDGVVQPVPGLAGALRDPHRPDPLVSLPPAPLARVMRVVSPVDGVPRHLCVADGQHELREGGVSPRSQVVGEFEALRVLDVRLPGLEGEVRHLLHAGVAYHGRDLLKVAPPGG